MFFGFDFYRDDSIKDLDRRIEDINKFLSEHEHLNPTHRHFGVFLLAPQIPTNSIATPLADKQSKSQYRLCIEFFDDSTSSFIPDLELIFNLGKTSNLYYSMQMEAQAVSYLCAYPENAKVQFLKSEKSISILFEFNDDDPDLKRIKNHLEFIIPNSSNKH